MNPTTSDKIFKVTSQGNLRVLIDPFVVMATAGVIRYGGGFVDCTDNTSGFVVVDSSTGVASVTTDSLDLTKVYLCSVQASQGVARVIDQYENSPWVAADYGGTGGGSPAVIAPFPGIGEEGVFYSQQVRTTGAAPQTFAVTDGDLPTGLTLDSSSGLITGTVAYPNGNLYTGEITVANSFGDVVYPFSILINGDAPAFTMPIMGTPGASVSSMGVVQMGDVISPLLPQGVTGSAVITYPNGSGFPTGVSLVDTDTGEVSGTITDAGQMGDLFTWGITAENIFGESSQGGTTEFAATIYWGDWNGALPGSFTVSNITTDLTHGAGFTAGPETALRACPTGDLNGNDLEMTWAALGAGRQRVFAIPDGFLTGSMAAAFSDSWYPEAIGAPGVPALLTPAWPTPYQSGLVINGVPYKKSTSAQVAPALPRGTLSSIIQPD